MSFRFNRLFHPAQALARFSNDLQLHWENFKARCEESAQAVIDAAKHELVIPLIDPTHKVREINRVQQVQVAVLYLADLFGVDYVIAQIKERGHALAVAAHDATFVAGQWLEGEIDHLKIFAEHIKQLAGRAAELEGHEVDSVGYITAFGRHAMQIIHGSGIRNEDDLAALTDYVLADKIDYDATVTDASSAAFSETVGPDDGNGSEQEGGEDNIPGSGDDPAAPVETGGETHVENGETITNGVPEPDRSHIGDDIAQADTSVGAEQPDSEDEGAGSNDDTDTAPAGSDAADAVEEAEESRDSDEAGSE